MAAPAVMQARTIGPTVVQTLTAEDESSAESDDEALRRRRTPCTALKLIKALTAAGFRARMSDFYIACCESSNRPRGRTIRFIARAEVTSDSGILRGVPKRWENFVTVLYTGVVNLAGPELKRQLSA